MCLEMTNHCHSRVGRSVFYLVAEGLVGKKISFRLVAVVTIAFVFAFVLPPPLPLQLYIQVQGNQGTTCMAPMTPLYDPSLLRTDSTRTLLPRRCKPTRGKKVFVVVSLPNVLTFSQALLSHSTPHSTDHGTSAREGQITRPVVTSLRTAGRR